VASDRERFYGTVQDEPDRVFPITFRAPVGVTVGLEEGVVEGFYWQQSQHDIKVEREAVPPVVERCEGEIELGPRGIIELAGKGHWEAALELAGSLIADNPRDPETWRIRATVYRMQNNLACAVEDAVKGMECQPDRRDLYPWICLLQLQAQCFEDCLKYCEAGLAATGGEPRTAHMDQEHLLFLGAYALYELGLFQEAITRLESVAPQFGLGRRGEVLMTQRGLLKACRNALAKGKGRPDRR